MVLLGVNIDHVATVRQARRGDVPSVVEAALAAVKGGADSITAHLREDRRHIQDADVAALKRALKVRLNLEMAPTEEMVRVARVVRPASVCLVPERRQELTTEGGLDVLSHLKRFKSVTEKIKTKGILVSYFIDPEPALVEAAKAAGADAVELHTGAYSRAASPDAQHDELKKIQAAAARARELGLTLNAGHGLDYDNVGPVAHVAEVNELNIGFSIIGRALFVGLEQAVKEMRLKMAAV
jgi:pyridoxine 5-phosphate synthase